MTALRILALLLAVAGLGACGKKGDVRAPDDEKNAYVFPRAYPAPASVIPPASTPEDADSAEQEPAEEQLEPRNRGRLSPFPLSPDRSQKYGS